MRTTSEGGFSARTRLVFVLAFICIAAVVAVSAGSYRMRTRARGEVDRTLQVIADLAAILSALQDAETGQRGFLLTKEERYLEPYQAAHDQVLPTISALRGRLTAPSQLERLDALELAAQAKLDELQATIATFRAGNASLAMALVRTGEGRATMDRCRALVAEMIASETTTLAMLEKRQHLPGVLVFATTVVGNSVLFLLTLLAGLGAQRDLLNAHRIAEERKRTADYQQRAVVILGHDIRSPLTAIELSSARLLQSLEAAPRDHPNRRAAEVIRRSSHRALRLVNSLLDLTHLRLGGGLPLEPAASDVQEVVRNVVLEADVSEPGRVALASSGDGRGVFDAVRVGQAVSNLISNALKYGRPDRVVTVKVDASSPEWLRIEVHNEGAPIPPEQLPVIFDPFRRGDAAAPGARESLGLGLYIVSEIARAHGGDVSVTSTEGDGTRFRMALPRRPPVLSPESAPSAEATPGLADSRPGLARRAVGLLARISFASGSPAPLVSQKPGQT